MLNRTASKHAGQEKHLGVVVEKNVETINPECNNSASKDKSSRVKGGGGGDLNRRTLK